MTPARLYIYDTLLQRLPQHLEDMAAELRQLIQKEPTMVGQRHLTRHRHMAAPDQPRIRDRMMGRAKRLGRDTHRADASEAGDTIDVGGVDGLDQEPVLRDHRAIGRHYVAPHTADAFGHHTEVEMATWLIPTYKPRKIVNVQVVEAQNTCQVVLLSRNIALYERQAPDFPCAVGSYPNHNPGLH
jgi:hypothetical protein